MMFNTVQPLKYQVLCGLIICITNTVAIKVDWNTNPGPIKPATTTVPPPPQPPFRNPAPVWEDQSNDIANPNEYKYIPPPPSRPRYNSIDDYSDKARYNSKSSVPLPVYGQLIAVQPNAPIVPPVPTIQVASLATKYIPNIGNVFYAIVPSKINQLKSEQIIGYYIDGSQVKQMFSQPEHKYNGQFNPKTKKYKAYYNEGKLKFSPQYPMYKKNFYKSNY